MWGCRQRFDGLTDTIFAGHHLPLRTWIACLHLMGLNLSGLQIAQELDINKDDARAMIGRLRQGIVDRRPSVVLEGEVEVTFRGETLTARAGETINVPANSPHAFRNLGDRPARLLCLCAPAGQDEFFTLVGQPVATRTTPPPPLDPEAQAAFLTTALSLAPTYRTELPPPPGPAP